MQKNKAHYIECGYIFTKIGEVFEIDIKHITKGSYAIIRVQCDYCGTIIEKEYYKYLKNKNIVNKDSCSNCISKKIKESNMITYGVESVLQLKEVKNKSKIKSLEKYGTQYPAQSNKIKEKIRKTNISKYGVEVPAKNKTIAEKIKNTCIEKYGCICPSKNKNVQNKIKQTNIKRYGVNCPSKNKEIKEKIKQTNLKRHGVEYPTQNKNIQDKIRQSFYKNNSGKISTQQLEIYNMLLNNKYNVKLNYPINNLSLDIGLFVDNYKIDIEYDGVYWHQDEQKDRRRDEFLKSEGWKILRIKSNRKMPTLEQLIEGINKLIKTTRTFTQIELEDVKNILKESI